MQDIMLPQENANPLLAIALTMLERYVDLVPLDISLDLMENVSLKNQAATNTLKEYVLNVHLLS